MQPHLLKILRTSHRLAKQASEQDTASTVGASTALFGGTALARSGMRDIDFANRSVGIFDDAANRLRRFSKLEVPTNTSSAINSYKDLADTLEQLSRSSDDLVTRSPMMSKLLGVTPTLGKDSVRVSVVRSLLRNLHPGGELDFSAVADRSKDVIGRVRAAGFADYDRGPDIIKNFGKLQSEARSATQLAGSVRPQMKRVTGILRGAGQAKTGIGTLAALAGGAWLASRPDTTKKAAFSEAQTDASAALSPLSALLLAAGVRDVAATPKDVLVSYGADDRLGAGHASPGRNIAAIVNQDPRFRAKNVRAVEAPTTQGLLTTSNPDALKGRYALGVDTGWGVLEDKYNKSWGHRDFETGGSLFRDAVVKSRGPLGGEAMVHGGGIIDRVGRVLKFHPDAPSTVSGNNYGDLTGHREPKGVSGILSRLFTRQGKYHNMTYGDGSQYGGNNLSFVGAAHPAANVDPTAALDRKGYARLVAEELAASNKGTTVDDWLARIGDRKIISVSGASRGDSVGARVAAIHEALKRNGDDVFILGLGGKNKAAQQAIAAASGIPESSMGFAGFTKRFVPLAQNSDLHFMGMGGASPYEMLSSAGRAPIVRALDEEVFDRVFDGKDSSPEGVRKWLDERPRNDGSLNRGAGIAGRQIELARKALEAGNITDPLVREALEEAASYHGSRDWMNPTRLVDQSGKVLAEAGSHSKLKRGLDGILDYLNKNKVRSVAFGDGGGGLDQLLAEFREGKLSGLDDAARQVVRGDIAASKAGLADEVFKNWKRSRNITRLKGTGKAALGAASLAPLLASIFGKKEELDKRASDERARAIADTALVAGGGALMDGGMRAQLATSAMQNLQSRAFAKDIWNPLHAADLMDDYALAGQRLMRGNPLGIPSRWIGNVLPLSEWQTALTNPAVQTARLADHLGAKRLAASLVKTPERQAALRRLRDAAAHYTGFAENPHATLIRELDHSAKWLDLPKNLRSEIQSSHTIGDALRRLNGHGSEGARWQVGKFTENFMGPGRGPHAYGPVNRALGRAGVIGGAAAATIGLSNLLRRYRSSDEA